MTNQTTAIREIVCKHLRIWSIYNDKRKDQTRRLKFIPQAMAAGSPSSRMKKTATIKRALRNAKIPFVKADFVPSNDWGPVFVVTYRAPAFVKVRTSLVRLAKQLRIRSYVWDHNDKVMSIQLDFPEGKQKYSRKEVAPLVRHLSDSLKHFAEGAQ